ncbi:hypothetical protein HDV63DRAFT_231859 [Trichoderma sp. SZMC 28014]
MFAAFAHTTQESIITAPISETNSLSFQIHRRITANATSLVSQQSTKKLRVAIIAAQDSSRTKPRNGQGLFYKYCGKLSSNAPPERIIYISCSDPIFSFHARYQRFHTISPLIKSIRNNNRFFPSTPVRLSLSTSSIFYTNSTNSRTHISNLARYQFLLLWQIWRAFLIWACASFLNIQHRLPVTDWACWHGNGPWRDRILHALCLS